MAGNPSVNNTQILVVDDEPDLRTLYELTLLREGFRVEAAASLKEAWQLLTERRFDVVITDMSNAQNAAWSLPLMARRKTPWNVSRRARLTT
jgi:DNA-binding NtrC family response regulator